MHKQPPQIAEPLGLAGWIVALFRTVNMPIVFTRLTDVIAFFAVFAWLDPSIMAWVQQSSQFAALVTPIFALVWLVTQIAIKIAEFFRGGEDDKDEE